MCSSDLTVPMGTDDSSIDIATLTFELPIWIAPPVKVTHMNVIQKIVASVYDSTGQIDKSIFDPNKLLIRRVITLLGYGVLLVGNKLQLVKKNEGLKPTDLDQDSEVYDSGKDNWRNLINVYGTLTNGTSQVRLELDNGGELIGTVAYDPTDQGKLLFNVLVDTIPTNTLPAINAIINPYKNNVIGLLYDESGNYKITAGTRFIILDDIGSKSSTEFAQAWAPNGVPIIAKANDIIEYDGTKWFVSFDSNTQHRVQYVTNTNTNVQYKWISNTWVKSYEGLYREATWRLVL